MTEDKLEYIKGEVDNIYTNSDMSPSCSIVFAVEKIKSEGVEDSKAILNILLDTLYRDDEELNLKGLSFL